MNDIRHDDLLRLLPRVLKEDKAFHAFASVMAKQLKVIIDDTNLATIYARIDVLPEELLDVLAYDFKVDWWDYDYSVEQKRQTLKDSFLVHKHLGTKFAVETAIRAIYPKTDVEEWFQFGGEPYTFRLLINVSGIIVDPIQRTRVLNLVNYYKNLRSHLSGIEYTIEAKEAAWLRIGGQLGSVVKICIPEIADTFAFEGTLHIGGAAAAITSLQIPSIPDDIAFHNTVYTGGRMANVTTITMPIPQEADGQ